MKVQLYPDVLKERLHQLHYGEGKVITEVIVILSKEFPKLKKRMTRDRMSSLARYVRMRKGLSSNKKAARKDKPRHKSHRSKNKKEMIVEARRLRQRGYRWQAICDELAIKIPKEKIPTANSLSVMVKGRSYKSKNGNNQYTVSITGPSGVVLDTIPSPIDVQKLIHQLLGA